MVNVMVRSKRNTQPSSQLRPTQGRTAAPPEGANPVDVHVGSRLRLRRNLIGLTQTELADRVGLTFQAVQKYERGENRISASRLHQFSQALGVSVSFFFEGLPGELFSGTLMQSDRSDLSDREVQELVTAFNGVKDMQLRKSLLKVLKDAAALTTVTPMVEVKETPKVGRKKTAKA